MHALLLQYILKSVSRTSRSVQGVLVPRSTTTSFDFPLMCSPDLLKDFGCSGIRCAREQEMLPFFLPTCPASLFLLFSNDDLSSGLTHLRRKPRERAAPSKITISQPLYI